MNANTSFAIRRVQVTDIIDLRRRALFPDFPREAALTPEDNKPNTWHLALVDNSSSSARIVCCATFVSKPFDGLELAWQLRGMATEPALCGRGYGKLFLPQAESLITSESGVYKLWCNGRILAVLFLVKLGWTIDARAGIYKMPPAGVHRLMWKRVTGAGRS